MKKVLFANILCFAAVPAVLFSQGGATDPFSGTWKLNIAKSKVSPGPAPSDETLTAAPDGKIAIHEVGSDGKLIDWSFDAVENTAVPIRGLPEESTVVTRHVGRALEHTWHFGTGTMTDRGVISKDGKTLTVTATGTNGKGQPVHDVLVFEKP
jgi:hypothetical protein